MNKPKGKDWHYLNSYYLQGELDLNILIPLGTHYVIPAHALCKRTIEKGTKKPQEKA